MFSKDLYVKTRARLERFKHGLVNKDPDGLLELFLESLIIIYCSFPSINQPEYSVNEGDDDSRDSVPGTPVRPHKLGYGAVMSSHTGSPNINSPSQTSYLYKD